MLIGKASPEDVSLHPLRYKWAYDLYNQAVRNTWFPHEIALQEGWPLPEKWSGFSQHSEDTLPLPTKFVSA